MKELKLVLVFLMVTAVNFSFAQNNGLAKSIGVFVFPNKDQSPETQNKDESDCYKWAKEQTNYDPMNPTVVTANVVDTSPDGAAVRGAARGAAAGAAIGSISGDMGEGAAYGAIIGGLRNRRAKKQQNKQQQQANNAATDAKRVEMANEYKRAFSTCLQAKSYTVN